MNDRSGEIGPQMSARQGAGGDAAHQDVEQRLSPAEFSVHFGQSVPKLWCIALAITRDPHLSEDVLQETALVGLRKIDDFTPGTDFGAWTGQITRNIALRLTRNKARRGSAELEEQSHASPEHGVPPTRPHVASLDADRLGFDDRVIGALGTLDEVARTCLLFKVVLGMPYREIASFLGIPEGTAMSHVHRSRHALAKRLGGTP